MLQLCADLPIIVVAKSQEALVKLQKHIQKRIASIGRASGIEETAVSIAAAPVPRRHHVKKYLDNPY